MPREPPKKSTKQPSARVPSLKTTPAPSVSSIDTLASNSASTSSDNPSTEELDFLLSCFPGWSADQLRSAMTTCRQDIAATVQHILDHGESEGPQTKCRADESIDGSLLCSIGLSSVLSEESGGVLTKSTGESNISARGKGQQLLNDTAAIEARYAAMQKGKRANHRGSQHSKERIAPPASSQSRQQPSLVAIARGAIHSPSIQALQNNHWHRFENDIQSILTVCPTVPRSEITSRLHANGGSVQDTIDDLFETFDFTQTADLLPTMAPRDRLAHGSSQLLGPGGQMFPPLLGSSKSAPIAASNMDAMLVQLASIFPNTPVTQLQTILKRTGTVDAAIDSLLGSDGNGATARPDQSPGLSAAHRSRVKAKAKPASTRQTEAELLSHLFAFKSYVPSPSTLPLPSPPHAARKPTSSSPPPASPETTARPSPCRGPRPTSMVHCHDIQPTAPTQGDWDLDHCQSMLQHYMTKRNETFRKAVHAFQCRKQLGKNSGTAFYYSQEGHR
ncbi:hypothetical protein H4R35_005948 [Dimargaris xerosporica]|nr:hypothetical protein H4R35_005948 [Dimargaris xerosporica]